MEDVIEERAIEKMCGYALCKNLLTKVISQRYHISTSRNKVYDVRRRKNFCSSFCYGAANYLLEQMLSSPLWLRENEKSPKFRLLPENEQNNSPGEEVIYKNSIDPHESVQHVEDDFTGETINKISTELPEKGKTKCVTFQLPNVEKDNEVTSQNQNKTCVTSILVEDIVENDKLTVSSDTLKMNQRKESVFQKERKLSKKCYNNADTIGSLVKRIESVFKEWITEDTLRLLFGKEIDKQEIFKNLEKHEKYITLCQKLNELQFNREIKQTEIMDNISFKTVPDYSVLQEEGKKLQLKVLLK